MRISLIAFCIVLAISIDYSESSSGSACNLFNDHYKEYLYSPNFFFATFSKRHVYTWLVPAWYTKKYKSKFEFTDHDPKGVWYFEPAKEKDTYFLRNNEYKEYLYASDQYAGHSYFVAPSSNSHTYSSYNSGRNIHSHTISNQNSKLYNAAHDMQRTRRPVYTSKKVKELSILDDSFKWVLKKIPGKDLFVVYNKEYEEPLYAADFFLKQDEARRTVFTWNQEPDSRSFLWIIKCNNNSFLPKD